MKQIAATDIKRRIERDNPWWKSNGRLLEDKFPRREYFSLFASKALNFRINRASILLGPRRVGKTVMLKQLIQQAIDNGIERKNILYVSIDTPVYSGISLEDFINLCPGDAKIIIFDEIQYLKNWEVHLKDLIDSYKDIKFVASGSAAAALRLKSKESGAGRFSDFMLPPLTFHEFLKFIGEDENLISVEDDGFGRNSYLAKDIDKLNDRFIEYLNYGGYPEAVLNEDIRADPDQFIRNDIIDKVLLKDLPSLYGIDSIQELNKLFSVLAYNAGGEANLENISKQSGITKPTIRRYIEYLESAFLIMKVSTVDDNCKSMQRERNFKIYLNNPSMRAALFSPVDKSKFELLGHLTECAIFSQWQHASQDRYLRYARWRNEGEIDIVYLDNALQKPMWAVEIKWSDRVDSDFRKQTRSLASFIQKHSAHLQSAKFTTKTIMKDVEIEDFTVNLVPSSLYCYTVGRNITSYMLVDLKE